MASEKHAHLARERHSAYLRSLGAHAIVVDRVRRGGQQTYGVIALFDKPPRAVPQTLPVKTGGKTIAVPLVARRAPRFKLE